MEKYNVAEVGKVIYLNFNEDITGATKFTLILEPRYGSNKTITQDIIVGTVTKTVNNERYQENQYIEYVTKENDLDKSGLWQKKGKALFSQAKELITDYKRFTVLE